MPVRTACPSCEKALQVRDELAGKKIKCPACETVFVVAPSRAPTGVKAAAAKSPQVKAAPKRPAPPVDDEEEDLDDKPVRGRNRSRDEDEDEDEDEDDKPARSKAKKKKKKSAPAEIPWLWVGVGGGVLVLLLAVGAFFLFFSGQPTGKGPSAQNKNKQNEPNDEGQQPVKPKAGSSLADLVPGDAWVFATVHADLYNAPPLEALRTGFGPQAEEAFLKEVGFPLADLERVSVFSVADFAEAKQNKTLPVVVLVQTKKPFDQSAVMAAMKKGDLGKNPAAGVEFLNDRTLVASLKPLLQAYKDKLGKQKATGVLQRALAQAATSKGIVIAAVVPPEAIQEAQPLLKDAPFDVSSFLKTQAVLTSLDLTDKLQLNVALTMADATAAEDAKALVTGLVASAGIGLQLAAAKDPQLAEVAKVGKQALKDLKIGSADKDFTVAFQTDASMLAGLILPAIEKVRGAATGTLQANHLKQIALAWHSYHDRNRSFPPQTLNKGLSWRVAILPFIEQENLYNQFKLDEPWNSAHNKKLIPLMPKVYEPVGGPIRPGYTHVQTFVGPNTINKDVTKGLRDTGIRDGTSNTLIVAEAATAVEWTRPADIAVTPSQIGQLGASDPQYIHAALADGSYVRLRRNLDPNTLRLLIDPNDGMPTPPLDR